MFLNGLCIPPPLCLSDDLDTLQSMTAESVVHNMENVGNEVEDFLKKGTTNDDA